GALGWLLRETSAASALPAKSRSKPKRPDDGAIRSRLESLAATSKGTIAIASLPVSAQSQAPPAEPGRPVARRGRRLARPLPRGGRVERFSSLGRGREETPRDAEADERDYDARPSTGPSEGALAPRDAFLAFPAGRHAGRCLHAIFEGLDF